MWLNKAIINFNWNNKGNEMPNSESFNCINGTSYLFRNIFNMTLPVYIFIKINSKGFSAEASCSTAFSFIVREGLSLNCDSFCLDATSRNSVFVIFRVSLLADTIRTHCSGRDWGNSWIAQYQCWQVSSWYRPRTFWVPNMSDNVLIAGER